jgi:hypothetical protein
MDRELETRALREVQERLTQRFPYVGAEVVEAAVRVAAYSKLTGPVRDFVPVLVEHEARQRLAHIVDYSSPPSERQLVSG